MRRFTIAIPLAAMFAWPNPPGSAAIDAFMAGNVPSTGTEVRVDAAASASGGRSTSRIDIRTIVNGRPQAPVTLESDGGAIDIRQNVVAQDGRTDSETIVNGQVVRPEPSVERPAPPTTSPESSFEPDPDGPFERWLTWVGTVFGRIAHSFTSLL